MCWRADVKTVVSSSRASFKAGRHPEAAAPGRQAVRRLFGPPHRDTLRAKAVGQAGCLRTIDVSWSCAWECQRALIDPGLSPDCEIHMGVYAFPMISTVPMHFLCVFPTVPMVYYAFPKIANDSHDFHNFLCCSID